MEKEVVLCWDGGGERGQSLGFGVFLVNQDNGDDEEVIVVKLMLGLGFWIRVRNLIGKVMVTGMMLEEEEVEDIRG